MNKLCPYCNKEIFSVAGSEIVYKCNAHKYAMYIYFLSKDSNSIRRIDFDINYKMILTLFPTDYYTNCKNCMILIINDNFNILPYDQTVTPDNIDKKIKTYLTFL